MLRVTLRNRRLAFELAGLVIAIAIVPLLRSAALDARAPLEIRVFPKFAFAPADIDVSVSIEPDDDNRAMTVTLESRTFLRESTISLDGSASARMRDFRFRAVPAGDYEIRVQLFDARQRPRRSARDSVSLS